MTLSKEKLGKLLILELEKGYDISRISGFALQLYNDPDKKYSPEIEEKLLQLMAMEMGSEFECTEQELREYATEWITYP